jgi:hypothetical protein
MNAPGCPGNADQYRQPTLLVTEAVDQIRLHWNRADDIKPDAVPDFEVLQAWHWIPNCYSLVEQAFKLLWAVRHQAPVDDFRKSITRIGAKPGLSHDLGYIFSKLDPVDQDEISSAYRAYRDLHDYIPVRSARELLDQIGDGYTPWRYFLLEGAAGMPTSDVGVMIEIAFIAAGLTDHLLNGASRFRTVDVRVSEALRQGVFDELNFHLAGLQSDPGFDSSAFEPEWQRHWRRVDGLANDSPGLFFLALDGGRPSGRVGEPGDIEIVRRLCSRLPAKERKNLRRHFFKLASPSASAGSATDTYFLQLHREGALYHLRAFAQVASAVDIANVKMATDRLSLIANANDLTNLPVEVKAAMETITKRGLPDQPPLVGESASAVAIIAAPEPVAETARPVSLATTPNWIK